MRMLRTMSVAVGLLALAPAAPALAGLGAGVTGGYLHINLDDNADTYQVGPMIDYWGDKFGFAAKALFSTYTFDFSQQVDIDVLPMDGVPDDLFAVETDDNFRVDFDAAARYLATDWLILLGGFRFELQDFDSNFSLAGDPALTGPLLNDPAVRGLLAEANGNFGRGFKVYSLALAATVFTRIGGEGPAVYLTGTVFPFAYVNPDITLPVFDVVNGGVVGKIEARDIKGFGGVAVEAGADQSIPWVDGLSVGVGVRLQRMVIFGNDNLFDDRTLADQLNYDDEILISVLPYVHMSF